MAKLKKGVSFSIGSRTLSKEITASEVKLLEANIKKINVGIEAANKKDGKKRVLKNLSDFLEPEKKKEVAPQEKAPQEVSKSK